MIVYAYLVKGNQVLVLRPGDEQTPADYKAVVSVDSGLIDDWAGVVRYAESVLWTKYVVHGGSAFPIEEHTACRQKTYLRRLLAGPQRKNLDGSEHRCPKSKRK